MRVGIHVGPIVAGIVGVKKFQYDVWGDTVNTASRMESNGAVGRVNISHHTYELVKDEEDLLFEYRGEVEAKGKGKLKMYFVELKTKPASTNQYKTPPLEVSVV
jgi:class 3 adenylate cyclase